MLKRMFVMLAVMLIFTAVLGLVKFQRFRQLLRRVRPRRGAFPLEC
jgi:hypothetical protein